MSVITPKVRLPFRLKVYDEKLREIETPVIWLEFDEPPNDGHWDWLEKVEVEAKKILIADLEVRVDWQANQHPENNAP